jgi:uncharacterized membrane protein
MVFTDVFNFTAYDFFNLLNLILVLLIDIYFILFYFIPLNFIFLGFFLSNFILIFFVAFAGSFINIFLPISFLEINVVKNYSS